MEDIVRERLQNLDILLPSVAGFIESIKGFKDETPLTDVTTIYSDIMPSLLYYDERD